MLKLEKRVRITGTIEFTTAFHLGSGEGGAAASDMGVLLDHHGEPLLPGSSLKGVFRSTAEALGEHLGLRVCYLEREHPWCGGANFKIGNTLLQKLDGADGAEVERILHEGRCDTCALFGSILSRGKLRFEDAQVEHWAGALELRDGVGIDRDSGTAVNGVKYDYEAVPAGARFSFRLTGENLSEQELALVGAVVAEWQRGTSFGGMTSRGFGAAVLQDVKFEQVDLADPPQRLAYLLEGTMVEVTTEELRGRIRQAMEALNA